VALWNIVGCGYTGTRLARYLLDCGHQVCATVRGQERARALSEMLPRLQVHCGEVGAQLASRLAPGILVWSVPPVAPDAERAALDELAAMERLVYLSSTGVYAPAKGAEVDEDFALAPSSEHGRRRLASETLFRHRAVILRIAAIYGPGRGVHVRIANGSYRVVAPGSAFVSRVHVDDLVSAIECVATRGPCPAVYNVSDLQPATSAEVADGVADMLGVSAPERVQPHEVSERARAMLGADRRIASTRLQQLGWTPRYPSWREGVRQAIDEGSIDV
jgi:nucleoside-diphosphate-sugar epimerase